MPKQFKKKLFIIIVIIAIIVVLVKVLDVPNIILKKVYPQRYSEYVYTYSVDNNVDPLLVFAIIKAESDFDQNVVSSSGAVGLMQLMEDTAMEQSKKLNKEYEYNDLYNPQVNIELGVAYLSELLIKYDGNYYLAATAYNAGIGVVDSWIENGKIKPDGSDIENIPYKETNNYVRKIVKNYKLYKNLYEA